MELTANEQRNNDIAHLVDVDGSEVRVLMAGQGEPSCPPLLLINGMGVRLEMWQPLASRIPDRPLLMFDFPGVTGRPAHDLPLQMPGIAQWLARLLDRLEIDEVDVVGYSWGGVLAQQFTRDIRERVRALVLASTNFGFGAVSSPELLPLLNLTLSDEGDDPLKLLTAALGGAPGSRNPVAAIVNALDPSTTPVEGYQRQFLSLTGWTSLNWLHELSAPTLVVSGDDDLYVPTSTTRKLARSIPGARLQLIRGGGHLLPINQPHRLAQAIESFLGRLDTQG